MRVLHVIPSVAPRYGGPSAVVVRYCRALGDLGVDAVIATTNADGTGTLPVPLITPTNHDGVETVFFERRGEAFKYSSGLAVWLRRTIATFDAVHIHAVFSHSSLAAGRASRLAGVPYVVRPLGSLDPWSLAQSPWRKRLLLWSAAGTLLRNAAGLHFTTDAELAGARPVIGDAPSRVVPLGIDDDWLAAQPLAPRDREPRIMALARFHRKKNLHTLIRAFHQAAGADSAWRLLIAGSGDEGYAAELRALAASGPAHSRIDFSGWLDESAKRAMLRTSSVFVMPSEQENFGLSALEAMGCGVPVIVSPAVDLAEQVQKADAGWVTGNDEAALAVTLRSAMQDEIGRHRRAMNARRLAARFTWASAAAALEAWYVAITRQPAASRGR